MINGGYKNSFSKGELARELVYMNEDYANLQQQLKKKEEVIEKMIKYIEKMFKTGFYNDDYYLGNLKMILEDKEVE